MWGIAGGDDDESKEEAAAMAISRKRPVSAPFWAGAKSSDTSPLLSAAAAGYGDNGVHRDDERDNSGDRHIKRREVARVGGGGMASTMSFLARTDPRVAAAMGRSGFSTGSAGASLGGRWSAGAPGGPADDADPIGALLPSRRGRGGTSIKSNGRGQPCSGQAEVARTYAVDAGLYAERSKVPKDMQVAPLGSKSDFHIPEGALVYATVRHDLRGRHASTGGPDQTVWGNVNGRMRGQGAIFVGQNKNRAGTKDGEVMAVITVVIAGTITTVNNGPEVWLYGDIIGFTTSPWLLNKKESRPAVEIKGHPTSVFMPTLVVIRETDPVVIIKRCAQCHESAIEVLSPRTTSLEQCYRAALDASSVYISTLGWRANKQPINRCIRWQALALAMRHCLIQAVHVIAEGKENCQQLIDAQKIATELLTAEARQGRDEYTRHISLLDTVVGTGPFGDPLIAEILAPVVHGTLGSMERAARIYTVKLPSLAEIHISAAQAEQFAYLRAHIVGRCLGKSEPGRPADLLLGYSFH